MYTGRVAHLVLTSRQHRKSQSRPDSKRNDSISIIVHDFAVVGPVPAANMSLAKGLASERAREVLGDPENPYSLTRICDCTHTEETEEVLLPTEVLDGVEPKKLDDETVEGFAALAHIAFRKSRGRKTSSSMQRTNCSWNNSLG